MTNKLSFRIIHRYLGFFLAGIMLVYAVSGFVLIFRKTDAFKSSQQVEVEVAAGLDATGLGGALKIKQLTFTSQEGALRFFADGVYDSSTGMVDYTKKELPAFLTKLNRIHKATTDDPLYWLNIFFAFSLFFFSISTFWMFKPKSIHFKKGMLVAVVGVALTILLIYRP